MTVADKCTRVGVADERVTRKAAFYFLGMES